MVVEIFPPQRQPRQLLPNQRVLALRRGEYARSGRLPPQYSARQRWLSGVHEAASVTGFTSSMSGKRMKSRSVVAIEAPCSRANAARCASITMAPFA